MCFFPSHQCFELFQLSRSRGLWNSDLFIFNSSLTHNNNRQSVLRKNWPLESDLPVLIPNPREKATASRASTQTASSVRTQQALFSSTVLKSLISLPGPSFYLFAFRATADTTERRSG